VCLLVFLTSHLRDVSGHLHSVATFTPEKSSSTIRQDGMQAPEVF